MKELGGNLEQVIILECNIDDMTGEELGFALECLLARGALDAWFTPIYMKKNRPAITISVLCQPKDAPQLRDVLLRETSTLGVRWRSMEREIANRRIESVDTPWGVVRCKVKIVGGCVIGVKPEFEDCATLAREHHVPLKQVLGAAKRASNDRMRKSSS